MESVGGAPMSSYASLGRDGARAPVTVRCSSCAGKPRYDQASQLQRRHCPPYHTRSVTPHSLAVA